MILDMDCTLQRGSFELAVQINSSAVITGLSGPSGSGKSSLLHAIAGLLRPKEGHIIVSGKTLFSSRQRINLPAQRRRMGLVFQDAQLFPHLSVKQNLLYGYQRLPPTERQIHPDKVTELLEIAHLLEKSPAHLSGGEKQRVALGRALLANPQLLLLDEPLAALDDRLKQQILPFLRNIPKQFQIPLLYVSHATAELNYLTDRIIRINNGLITGS